MYAVIRSGGKQYRVEPGQTIEIERLDGKVGGSVTFDSVVTVRTDETKFLGGEHAAKQSEPDGFRETPRKATV